MESTMDVVIEEVSTSSDKKIVNLQDILKSVSYISKGVQLNQPRLIQRAIRQNGDIRRYISKELLLELVSKIIPVVSPSFDPMMEAIQKLPSSIASASVATDGSLFEPPASVLPEVEIFVFTTIVTTLLRENLNVDAAFSATTMIERIRSYNRRSLDLLSSKAFFYLSLAYERIEKLENIRPVLLALYRTACVRHDEMGQAVLLNLLLRNYLQYNLVDQAQTLSLRTSFPEGASNNQFCRYLFYMGRIQAIQLEYSSAYQRLIMAGRKAPQDVGLGFTVLVQKLTVLVQLLMGDIPERSLFNQPECRQALKPYLFLTLAVRNGNLQQFNEVVEKYSSSFKADKNHSLVLRLGHNVLKTGLRKISLSYSRISLADVAEKLHLPSASSAEYICAKTIRDGVIEATIDHENGWLLSNEVVDVYSTEEPQKAFHKRIAFCLDVYNEAVKALRFPPDAYKKELKQAADKSNGNDEKSIEDLIKEMEDDFDE